MVKRRLTSRTDKTSAVPVLNLGLHRLEYRILRGNSRRYTYFRFRSDLTLEVVLPRGVRVDVERAIQERGPWVLREFDRLSKTKSVLESDMVMFEGNLFKVVYVDTQEEGIAVDFSNGVVEVRTRDRGRLRELVRRWFLKESSVYAVRKVAELWPKVGARPSRVDVREIGKWGYCTRTGRLTFSWQLIALPERLREYVVLHELTHLVEFNHSMSFRRKLGLVCPDYRKREKELDLIAPYDRLSPP
jgi:predicted metal-dependent hydrolase